MARPDYLLREVELKADRFRARAEHYESEARRLSGVARDAATVERASIVAWLRKQDDHSDGSWPSLSDLAYDIEAGAHSP